MSLFFNMLFRFVIAFLSRSKHLLILCLQSPYSVILEPKKIKSVTAVLCLVTQLCQTLCNPMDCSLPGFFLHGDSPGKNTGYGLPCPLPGDLPNPGIKPRSLALQRFFTVWATREAQEYWSESPIPSPANVPNPRIKLRSSALQADSLPTELSGKPS